jgi:hypothetical protein
VIEITDNHFGDRYAGFFTRMRALCERFWLSLGECVYLVVREDDDILVAGMEVSISEEEGLVLGFWSDDLAVGGTALALVTLCDTLVLRESDIMVAKARKRRDKEHAKAPETKDETNAELPARDQTLVKFMERNYQAVTPRKTQSVYMRNRVYTFSDPNMTKTPLHRCEAFKYVASAAHSVDIHK